MLRFSDSGKHPLQTVRSEKFGKGALSKILRSRLQLRWGGHSLSFRLKKKKKKKKETETTHTQGVPYMGPTYFDVGEFISAVSLPKICRERGENAA